MGENKKKIKKKELLRRIEDLEMKLCALRDKVNSQCSPQIPLVNSDTLFTRPVMMCKQCGKEPGGVCMSTNCPYAVQVTC